MEEICCRQFIDVNNLLSYTKSNRNLVGFEVAKMPLYSIYDSTNL